MLNGPTFLEQTSERTQIAQCTIPVETDLEMDTNHIINLKFLNSKSESAPKRQFNGNPDTERSRSVLINRYLHPSTPLRIQMIGLFGVGSNRKS